MRWYRQHARELLRDEGTDLVSFADEEVVDTAHGRDPRMRDSRAQLLGCPELVVLRRDDERAVGDLRQRARREAQVFRAHPDKGDGFGASVFVSTKLTSTLEPQLLWIQSFKNAGGLVRPRLNWLAAKNTTIGFGVDIFTGPTDGFFGRFNNRDRLYAEVRYDF